MISEKKISKNFNLLNHLNKHYLAWIVIICGILGTYAAFTLLLNRIEYFKNPNFIPPCSMNVWLDCGIVMKSKWASMFGFPNTIIGLMTYPTAILTGLMMLANPKNNRFLMLGCTALSALGIITNLTLLYISAYLIGSLCPWCILAGVATSNIFLALLTYCIQEDFISFKPNIQNRLKAYVKGLWTIPVVIIYYLLMALLVWLSFLLRENGVVTQQFFDPMFWLWGQAR
jgi:uncharacterized membrane protein